MLKRDESGKELSLNKSWGGVSPTRNPRSNIRATASNYIEQCFESAARILAGRNEALRRLFQRWQSLDRTAEECKGVAECLSLLEKENKKAENPKARLSLAAWAP